MIQYFVLEPQRQSIDLTDTIIVFKPFKVILHLIFEY